MEVAGNNGVFAAKVLSRVDQRESIKYTVIDDVPMSVDDTNIDSIRAFLTRENSALFTHLSPDLVICRHAIAHNPSLTTFFRA